MADEENKIDETVNEENEDENLTEEELEEANELADLEEGIVAGLSDTDLANEVRTSFWTTPCRLLFQEQFLMFVMV